MTSDIETLRYVPHFRRATYEALGWVWVVNMPGHHAAWSVLMKWVGDGEAKEP